MTETIIHSGGCRCGAVQFSVSAEPNHISYCHCTDCRKATGAPVAAFVGFAANEVALEGETLRVYENGPVKRSFCSACGSPIAYVDDRLANQIYFMLGAMDAPENYKPTHHAHVRSQLPFVHMPDGLERHPRTSVPRPEETPS
jgi:hypothetical protein